MRVFQVLIKRRIINCTAGKSALKLGNCDALKTSEDILLHKVTRFYRLLFGESGRGGVGGLVRTWSPIQTSVKFDDLVGPNIR